MTRQPLAFRLPADVLEWLTDYAGGKGERTKLFENLMVALYERRLLVAAEPAPYIPNQGFDAENPVLVCLNPE